MSSKDLDDLVPIEMIILTYMELAYESTDEARKATQLILSMIETIICTEKLKLLDEVIHQSTINLKSAEAVAGWAEIRKKQLGAEL